MTDSRLIVRVGLVLAPLLSLACGHARAQKIVDECGDITPLTPGQTSQYQYYNKFGEMCVAGSGGVFIVKGAPWANLPTTQTLVVTGTAQSLSVPTGATAATLSVTGGNVIYRDDGTAPTGTIGSTLYAGASPYSYVADLTKLQFILPSGGASATVTIGYYKQ